MRLIKAAIYPSGSIRGEPIEKVSTQTGRVRVWVAYAFALEGAAYLAEQVWLRAPDGETTLYGGGEAGGGGWMRGSTRVTFEATSSGMYALDIFAAALTDSSDPAMASAALAQQRSSGNPVATLALQVEVTNIPL